MTERRRNKTGKKAAVLGMLLTGASALAGCIFGAQQDKRANSYVLQSRVETLDTLVDSTLTPEGRYLAGLSKEGRIRFGNNPLVIGNLPRTDVLHAAGAAEPGKRIIDRTVVLAPQAVRTVLHVTGHSIYERLTEKERIYFDSHYTAMDPEVWKVRRWVESSLFRAMLQGQLTQENMQQEVFAQMVVSTAYGFPMPEGMADFMSRYVERGAIPSGRVACANLKLIESLAEDMRAVRETLSREQRIEEETYRTAITQKLFEQSELWRTSTNLREHQERSAVWYHRGVEALENISDENERRRLFRAHVENRWRNESEHDLSIAMRDIMVGYAHADVSINRRDLAELLLDRQEAAELLYERGMKEGNRIDMSRAIRELVDSKVLLIEKRLDGQEEEGEEGLQVKKIEEKEIRSIIDDLNAQSEREFIVALQANTVPEGVVDRPLPSLMVRTMTYEIETGALYMALEECVTLGPDFQAAAYVLVEALRERDVLSEDQAQAYQDIDANYGELTKRERDKTPAPYARLRFPEREDAQLVTHDFSQRDKCIHIELGDERYDGELARRGLKITQHTKARFGVVHQDRGVLPRDEDDMSTYMKEFNSIILSADKAREE